MAFNKIKGSNPGGSSGSSSTASVATQGKSQSSSSAEYRDFLGSARPEDIQESLDRYAQAAMSKMAADLERIYSDKLAFIQQAQNKVEASLKKATSLMETIETGLKASSELTKATADTHEEILGHIDTVKGEVATVKANAISALSIFVSFFAFITVSINVFSKASSIISAASLVLVFWCLLVGFNLLIAIQFKAVGLTFKSWFALGSIVFLSFIAVFLVLAFSPAGIECIRQYLA